MTHKTGQDFELNLMNRLDIGILICKWRVIGYRKANAGVGSSGLFGGDELYPRFSGVPVYLAGFLQKLVNRNLPRRAAEISKRAC